MTKLEELIEKYRRDVDTCADEEFLEDDIKKIDRGYAEYCCEQQKKICAENAELVSYECKEEWMDETFNTAIDAYGNIRSISKYSILNSPIFKEDGK